MEKFVIGIRNLEFSYRVGGFRLGVPDLQIAPGERIAVTGPSGGGKTTLLHLLAGILVPSKGSVRLDGTEVSSLNDEDRQDFRALKMGLVFQEFELLEYLDVLDNILLPYRVSPVLGLNSIVRDRARSLAEHVGFEDKIHRYPGHLSQGERQRVAVCRAMVTEPAVIFGDEPTGNLDSKNRDAVMDILFRYSEEKKAPAVIVTHDRELMERFDRIVDVREFSPVAREVAS
jgi:putative ABC transport system ATP-binding protein